MHLVKIDVIDAKPTQAVLAGTQDVLARQPRIIRSTTHRHPHLSRQHNLLAALLNRLTEDLLRGTLRIDISGVDQVDATLQAQINQPSGLLHIGIAHIGKPAPAPEGHRAHGHHRDPQTRPTQLPVLHAAIFGDQPRPRTDALRSEGLTGAVNRCVVPWEAWIAALSNKLASGPITGRREPTGRIVISGPSTSTVWFRMLMMSALTN